MNSYKNIISNQETRLNLLKYFKFIPDELMVKLQYKIKLGRFLDLKNPKRFTEKLQWYKLHYKNDLLTIASDKYRVREYIESKGLSQTLTKLYKVYSSPEEINLKDLPDKFVMKTNNGSGTNYFCEDQSNFDLEKTQKELLIWLDRDMYAAGREWSYKNISPKIIVEEFLEEKKHDKSIDGISDYKFLCFNGKPEYIIFDVDRFSNHKRNIYDIDWNLINVSTDKNNIDRDIPKPKGLNELIEVAKVLSEDFPFVRVDLYYVNEKVYFGELTFYPWTGYVQFEPDEFDFLLGEKFIITEEN